MANDVVGARRLERFGEATAALSIALLIWRFTEDIPTTGDWKRVLVVHGAAVGLGAVLAIAGRIWARAARKTLTEAERDEAELHARADAEKNPDGLAPVMNPLLLAIGGVVLVFGGLFVQMVLLP